MLSGISHKGTCSVMSNVHKYFLRTQSGTFGGKALWILSMKMLINYCTYIIQIFKKNINLTNTAYLL